MPDDLEQRLIDALTGTARTLILARPDTARKWAEVPEHQALILHRFAAEMVAPILPVVQDVIAQALEAAA